MRIPEFIVDLTKDPEDRFEEMGKIYRKSVCVLLKRTESAMLSGCNALIRPMLKKALKMACEFVRDSLGEHEYMQELEGLSRHAKVDVNDLVFANIVYDLTAAFKIPGIGCTGFVHGGPDNPLIARAMDWCIPEGIGSYSMVIRYRAKDYKVLSVGFPGINVIDGGTARHLSFLFTFKTKCLSSLMMEGCGCLVLIMLICLGIKMVSDSFNFLGENALYFVGITAAAAIAWKFYNDRSTKPVLPPEKPFTDPQKDGEIRELTAKPIFLAVAILAKFAKADGIVTPNEILKVEDILRDLELTGEDRREAIRIFCKHKLGVLDYAESLALFDRIAEDSQELRWGMCVMLLRLANADRVPSREAIQSVQIACEILNVDYSQIHASFQQQERQHQDAFHADFDTLGCCPTDSIATIKKRYRELTKTFHPDALTGKELHPDIIVLATEKWRKIQEAYERILAQKNS